MIQNWLTGAVDQSTDMNHERIDGRRSLDRRAGEDRCFIKESIKKVINHITSICDQLD